MSTNKTPNYNLHSWLPSDDFLLSEINANFASLDAAVATKAAQTALTALSADLQSEVHTRAEAVSALAAADLRLLTGSYTGTGSESYTITLGVAPKAVIICLAWGAVATNSSAYAGVGVPGGSGPIQCTEDGFKLIDDSYSCMNFSRLFHYIVLY